MPELLTWRAAIDRAMYGPDGFYRRSSPADHFRTSVTASASVLGEAIVRLVEHLAADAAPGAPLTVVDLGAGSGELLSAISQLCDPSRVRLVGVDLRARPRSLPDEIVWAAEPPTGVVGLVVAHELLDDVPVDVAEVDEPGRPRLVLVDPTTGRESLGPVVDPESRDGSWLGRWWPLEGGPEGARAEIGHPRDDAWTRITATLQRGLAVAIDYDHLAANRPLLGTLAAYREGRSVTPLPDGTCNITSHVALDACQAATRSLGPSALLRQRDALLGLGINRPRRPEHALAVRDPGAYVRALAARAAVAELLDQSGLGGFGWLVQAVGCPLPPIGWRGK